MKTEKLLIRRRLGSRKDEIIAVSILSEEDNHFLYINVKNKNAHRRHQGMITIRNNIDMAAGADQ